MAETQNSKQNVQAPQAGQTVIVNAIPGQDIVLEAAFDQADVKMDGGNVVFEFANGGQVVLDFTDLGEAQAPNVVMPDGTILDMQEFLAAMGEKDVEPAAGPDGGATGSGGVGEYQDDAGDVIGGTEKLGVLGARAFSSISVEALDADNPLPSAGFVSGAADEDGLVREWFVTPYNGNDDEADGDNPATAASVKGFLNYDFGSDGPADTLPFTWNLAGLPSVTSQGHQVLYEVSADGQTLNGYWEFEYQKPVFDLPTGGPEIQLKVAKPEVEFETIVQQVKVFSLDLTNLETGEYLFTLYRPLDHSEFNTEDDIVYNFTFTVRDGSGDPASGGLNLIIDDDSPVPVTSEEAFINRTVDEDDILTDLSTGNRPNDGDWRDGSFTGKPYLGWDEGPANIWGSVKSLVSFGADGRGDNGFSLSEDLQKLYDQGLTSQDERLEYRLVNGGMTLQAYVSGGQDEGGGDYPGDGGQDGYQMFKMQEPENDDRVVFELWLNSKGDYKFKLFDQIDHYDENDQPVGSLPIDLSSAIVATDGDGDSITLESGFVINITDDAPKLAGYEYKTVAENDIDTRWSEGTSPNDGKGWYFDGKDWHYDGSYTGDPGTNQPGPAYVSGSLADVVKFGADEEGTFRFSSDAVQKLYSTDFNFWGQAVKVPLDYHIFTNTETGVDTLVGFERLSAPGMSNPVFELKLDTQNGDYEFRLYDELRHTGFQSESIKINFGALIEAVDSDDDAISLNGRFDIKVVDDVPEPVLHLTKAAVIHDETPGIQGPDDTNSVWTAIRFMGIRNPGDDPDVDASPIGFAKSDSPVVSTAGSEAGADHLLSDNLSLVVLDSDSGLQTTEGYEIKLSEEWGRIVGRVDGGDMDGKAAFAIALGEDGKLYLAQYLSIFHGHADNPNDPTWIEPGKIVVRYSMTDTDFDTRYADADIGTIVRFADDGPSIGDNALVRLDDDALDNGIPGGIGDNIDSKHVSGELAHDFGADGGSLSWLASGAPEGFTYDVSVDGETLYVMQDGVIDPVLTLTLNSETGDYTVVQNNPILHADGNDENNQRFVVRYKVTDGDDDSVVGKLKISVDDDTPTIEDQSVQILSESFESFADISGNSWTVVKGVDGTIVGNDGINWTVNSAGIEIQSGNVGGSTASDGSAHAELDTHGNGNTLTTLSTIVNLPSSEVTLTFDYQPRPGSLTDSGMKVVLGGVSVTIESDASGNISFVSDEGVVATTGSKVGAWTPITLEFSGLTTGAGATLAVSGLGTPNTLGAYLDNIKMYADHAALTVDETTMTTVDAVADLSGFFAGEFGADGPGELAYALGLGDAYDSETFGLVDTLSGEPVFLWVNDAGQIEGRTENHLVFTVSLEDGTANVTLDQVRAVEHSDPTKANEPLNLEGMVKLTATITDADNDSASDSIDVKLVFHDDGPTIKNVSYAFVDDEGLDDGIEGGVGDLVVTPDSDNDEATFEGMLALNFGADGPGSISFADMDKQSGAVGSEQVEYSWDSVGQILTAKVTQSPDSERIGDELFKVEVTDADTGAYKVTLSSNVLHSAPEKIVVNAGNYQSQTAVNITVTAAGDANASLNVNDGAFGITSSVDGSIEGRFDEINYSLSGNVTASEIMTFQLMNGKIASSAIVELSEFFSKENGVGDERGAYELWLGNEKVQDGVFDATSTSGERVLVINGPEGGFSEIRFSALPGASVTGTDNSDYNVKQVTFDTSWENDAAVNLKYTVEDGDDDSAQGELRIVFDDDMPRSVVIEKSLEAAAPEDTFTVSGLKAGWDPNKLDPAVDYEYHYTQAPYNDTDEYYEEISWGQELVWSWGKWGFVKGPQSSYEFTDNSALKAIGGDDFDLNETFQIGEFTHHNNKLPGDAGVIKSAFLKVIFNVDIDGTDVAINHTVKFEHNETANTGGPVDDIVKIIDGTDKVEVTVNGVDYTLTLGFADQSGNPVSTIYTRENGDTSFDFVGKMEAVANSSVSGTVDTPFGADGEASSHGLVWNGDDDGNNVIEGEYGTLTVDGAGYDYLLNDNVDVDSLAPGTMESFSYTLTDADGDSATSVLNIMLQNPIDPNNV